jgi:hypothetical protein
MSVSIVGSPYYFNNSSGLADSQSIPSVAAQVKDKIVLISSCKSKATTMTAPQWNGQTFDLAYFLADTGEAAVSVYELEVVTAGTANITSSFSGYVYFNSAAIVLRDSSADSILISASTPQIYNSGAFPAASISYPSLPDGVLLLDFLLAMGWNTSYDDLTATTWTPNLTSRSGITNTGTAGINRLSVSSTVGTGANVTSTWTPSAGQPMYTHLLFSATSGTLPSIDSITPLNIGSSGTVTTSGMGSLTSLTITGKAVSSLVSSVGSSTFSIPSWADGVVGFKLGAGLTAVGSDGTYTATDTSVVLSPEVTHDYVEIESVNNAAGYLGAYFALNIGDQVKYSTASTLGVTENYIDVDGGIYTDYTGSQIIHVRNYSTGVVTQITLINGVVSAGTTLVGKQVSVSLGAMVARGAASKSITGNQASVSLGNITAKAGSVTSITGQQVGVSLGTITAMGNIPVAPKIVILGHPSVQLGIGIGI